jgi:hypothetical protein
MKELFKAVTAQVATIEGIRWVDMDKGQLRAKERPALAYPAALVSVSIPTMEEYGGGVKNQNATITIRLVFDTAAKRTAETTPEEEREKSLAYIDKATEAYEAFKAYEPDDWAAFACREFVQEDARTDGLMVIRLRWESNRIE